MAINPATELLSFAAVQQHRGSLLKDWSLFPASRPIICWTSASAQKISRQRSMLREITRVRWPIPLIMQLFSPDIEPPVLRGHLFGSMALGYEPPRVANW